MEKVRLGIIGIGSMGTGHAGNVLKGMVVYLIYSVSMRSGSYKKSRLKKVGWGFL